MTKAKRILPENALSNLTLSLEEIENSLMQRKLFVRTDKDSLWSVRKNGKVKFWKTRPSQFKIPVKFGWKYFGYITQDNKFRSCLTVTGAVNAFEII